MDQAQDAAVGDAKGYAVLGKDENVSGQKDEKSQEQLECERLCEQIYRETTEFVAQSNHLAGFIEAGRKLLNGPPLYNAPVLFIGYQPGGGVDARQQYIAAETHWPEVFEYLLVGQEPLWTTLPLQPTTPPTAIRHRIATAVFRAIVGEAVLRRRQTRRVPHNTCLKAFQL